MDRWSSQGSACPSRYDLESLPRRWARKPAAWINKSSGGTTGRPVSLAVRRADGANTLRRSAQYHRAVPASINEPRLRHPYTPTFVGCAKGSFDETLSSNCYLCGPERLTSRSARKTLLWRFAIHCRPLDVTLRYRMADWICGATLVQ